MDTGAQQGVVGKEQYDRMVSFLAKKGLQPRILPTQKGGARGVGGGSDFIVTAELPTAIAGRCETLLVNVVKEPVPFLLPVSFSKVLGMNLLMPKQKIHWQYLGVEQSYEELQSGHLAIDIFEFPSTGWIHPDDSGEKVHSNVKKEHRGTRSDFELVVKQEPVFTVVPQEAATLASSSVTRLDTPRDRSSCPVPTSPPISHGPEIGKPVQVIPPEAIPVVADREKDLAQGQESSSEPISISPSVPTLQLDRPFRSGAKNFLLHGPDLAKTLGCANNFDYAGQVVDTSSRHRSLEGPFFGDRFGIYRASTINGPWEPMGATSDFLHSSHCSNVKEDSLVVG